MKRSLALGLLAMLFFPALFAQLPPNQPEQDCFSAIPLCQNVYFQANAYQGRGLEPDEINGTISCMILGERNSVWYIFKVQTPGNLCFTITPVDSTDDYDWAVYNLTRASCSRIGVDPSLEVACNFTYNTGCAGETGPNGRNDCPGQFESCIPVLSGETYVLNVSNFNASNAGYTIDFSQSDATLYDDQAPQIVNLTSFCTGVEVEFSENVLCSSVAPGDFSFAGPDGPYVISQVLSEQCDQGGAFDRRFRLVVDPPIQQAGNYTLSLVGPVNDFCGNGAAPSSGTIFMPLPPTAAMAPLAPQCLGGNLFTFSYTGPSAVAAYQWDFGDGGTSRVSTPQYSFPAFGDQQVSLIIRDNNGCEDTTSEVITVWPAPVARALQLPPVCEDEPVTFISLSQYPGSALQTFSWRLGDGSIMSQTNFEHVFEEPGHYPTMIRTTNSFGCEDTASMRVTVRPKPTVDFVTEEDVCLGEPATLQFASSLLPFEQDNIASWTWDLGDSTVVEGGETITHLYGTGGGQEVALVVRSDKGCADTLIKEQMIWDPQPPQLTFDTVCIGRQAFLSAVPDDGGQTRWYTEFSGTEPFLVGASYQTVPVLLPQTYFVEQLTKQGCLSDRVSITASPWQLGEGEILGDTLVELPQAIAELSLQGDVEGVEYRWNMGDDEFETGPSVTHQYQHAGIFKVDLLVVDIHGCEQEWRHWVEVINPSRILAASAFTPNGDDINDEWRVIVQAMEAFELRIYNRQGRVVFQSMDPGAGWRGIGEDGRPVAEGVYVFHVKGRDAEGKQREESGTVTLIR